MKSPFNLADLFSPRIWSSFAGKSYFFPSSKILILDSLNLTWIGFNWKNALFINAHGDRKRNIKRLSDSCQIIELRPNPSFFVSGRVGWVGWFSRAGQKADLGKTCGCALSHLLPHACQHYGAPCSNHSAHSLILLGKKKHPGVVWQKKRPPPPLQTNVLSSDGRQAVLLLPISVSPCWQVLSVCLKTF